jgi:hypothetical protein
MASISTWEGGLRVLFGLSDEVTGDIEIEAPNGETTKVGSYGGGVSGLRLRPPDYPGRYHLLVGGERVSSVEVTSSMAGTESSVGYGWNGRIVDLSGFPGEPATTEQENYDPDGPEPIDPSNYAGVVNADNDEGIAPAPRLRQNGVELGPDGATFELPDGSTVDVGAIEDEDEVARYIEGDQAGEVVDADQPATDSGSDSSSSGTGATTSTGDLGPAVAVVALLGLGYAATQR